jgi:superfamily I DNA/RNA helicase
MMQMAKTWEAVQEMAKEDQDFRMAVKRVDEYHSNIPYLCEELKMAGETSREKADVILSTVHKAKGDEFDAVKLGEDFPDLIRWSKKARSYVPMKAELCIFFVAVTRAREVLYANSIVPQLRTWRELLNG